MREITGSDINTGATVHEQKQELMILQKNGENAPIGITPCGTKQKSLGFDGEASVGCKDTGHTARIEK